MSSRVKKYSPGDNPFINFEIASEVSGNVVSQVFLMYLSLKLARIRANPQDAVDERFTDSLVDLANYSMLWNGYLIKKEEDDEDVG